METRNLFERTHTIEELYKIKDLMYRIAQATYAKGYAEANYNHTNNSSEAKLVYLANQEKEKLQKEFKDLLFKL